jgi:GNAT superfamily N-acetyltransferase
MSLDDDAHLASLAWENECEGWRALGSRSSSGVFRLESLPGLTCAWWQGNPLEMDHYLLVHPRGWSDPARLLEDVSGCTSCASNAVVLRFLRSESHQAWSRAVEARGFVYRDASPLMAASLDQRPPLPPADDEIRAFPVHTVEQHHQALNIIHEVYGGPRKLSEFFNPVHTVQIYLATYAGQPAASATLWPYAGVAGIYSVATRPRFRRRGLASAVVEAALQGARRAGFTTAALRTTQNLFPLYEPLGFRQVGEVLRYVQRNWLGD